MSRHEISSVLDQLGFGTRKKMKNENMEKKTDEKKLEPMDLNNDKLENPSANQSHARGLV